MNGRLRIDRDLLIITGITLISMFGICLLLFLSWLRTPESSVSVTNTPFKFVFLATEITTVDPNFPIETPTEEVAVALTAPVVEGEPSAEVLFLPTLLGPENTTPTSTLSVIATTPVEPTDDVGEEDDMVFAQGTYNDTDSRISYDGDWTNELFVDSAFDETLYISTSTGNTAIFRFLGRQLVIGYLGSTDVDLGTATVVIDGKSYQMNQSTGSSWTSPQLASAQHSVVITHKTGDLLFLDYLEIQ